MVRPLLALLLVAVAGCGKPSAPPPPRNPGVFKPLSGILHLTVRSGSGDPIWALLSREGVTRVEKLSPNERRTLRWHEEVDHPREWKLKFGPTKHPAYRLVLVRDGPRPAFEGADQEGFHDPQKALAVAYFAIPLDGERELELSLLPPPPLEVRVLESSGAPAAGVPVVAIPSPRYFFSDGFDAAGVDSMQLSSRWAYFNFDPEPHTPDLSARWRVRRTDATGRCRFEGFTGWVGISEKTEHYALPRNRLVMDDVRSVDFVVHRPAAKLRLDAKGLPGSDFHFRERGFLVEGHWPAPPGTAPRPWSEKIPFVGGDFAEFTTPSVELRLTPLSRVHRIKSGGVVRDLKPGESRRHLVELEPLPHRVISGEVLLEDRAAAGKEQCIVELWGAAMLDMDMTRGGSGVAGSGRVPFVLRALDEGPYSLVVRTGSYPITVVPDVKAPREGLSIRMTREAEPFTCPLTVRTAEGAAVPGFVVGTWPHRDLVQGFWSGSAAKVRPGLNTLVVLADAGVAVLRDVKAESGTALRLEAVLSPGAVLKGRLVDGKGAPLAGEWVHVSWPGYLRMANAYRWLADRTGPDGRFEIARVPAGPWRLYAHSDGGRLGDEFTLSADARVHDLGEVRRP